ncbi:helix-turn-helix domain-containing protein, partial [uncultured Fusobacterium sp.]
MEKSELKSLDVNVINFILQNNKATIENLCNCFDVSQVNIRNVLAKIEIFIKKNNIGVLLKENNEYFFENNSLNLNFDYTKLQTKNIEKSERIAYILLKLFFHKTINLTRISQELDISRITLNGDLEHIKSFLKEFNLDLVSIQWRGIFLQGDPFMIEKVSVLFIAKLYLE